MPWSVSQKHPALIEFDCASHEVQATIMTQLVNTSMVELTHVSADPDSQTWFNPGEELLLDERELATQAEAAVPPTASATAAFDPPQPRSHVLSAVVPVAAVLGLAAVLCMSVGMWLYLRRQARRTATGTQRLTQSLANLNVTAEEEAPLSSEHAEGVFSSTHEQHSARVNFAGEIL